MTLQGHSEDFPEATADQPGDLGGLRLEPTGLEEDSEDKSSNLRSQPDRRRQGQKFGTCHQHPGTTQRIPKSSQHAHAVNAPSLHKSA
ncbi:unnamed protein product [Schistocephalus solidus]|uniref:Spermatogenesis associated 33 n=1 Tax=Schistocephalus solidus TaxID=70667 RepID=A0A183SMA1_SCHSO|nr:unnamed protein product [Schistocephalus solidus]